MVLEDRLQLPQGGGMVPHRNGGITRAGAEISLTRRNMDSDSLAYANSSHSALVQALCREVLNDGVNLNISAADEMLLFFQRFQSYLPEQAVAMYFESGRRIWRTLRQILAWRFGSPGWGGQILDFASGFGRVTRHIVAEVAPDSIWVSDIYAAGVAFQQREFGVHGIVSTADPNQFPCDRTFDCILVSSLFTHLPEPRFMEWLHRLGSLVTPGGALLLSVHDMSLHSQAAASASTPGIVFEELSESGSLDTGEYGSSWVTEEFVRSAVRQAIGPCPVLRIPRGLASFQDLYVVPMGEASDSPAVFSSLEIEREPDGFFEHCSWVGKRRLYLSGWIGDRVTRRPPREVLIRIGDVLVASCRELQPRPLVEGFAADPMEAFGWQATVEIPPDAHPELACLSIRPVLSEGEEVSLYSGPVLWACLRSAQLDAATLHTRLLRREADHDEELARQRNTYESKIAELAGRVRWMEASRFWKARNLWFRFKRAVGLTPPETLTRPETPPAVRAPPSLPTP